MGLLITRNTNNVDDIVNGVTIELKEETVNAVGVGASYDSRSALFGKSDQFCHRFELYDQ